MQGVILQDVIMQCHYAEFLCTVCPYAEYRYAVCHCTEGHYSECIYSKCRYAIMLSVVILVVEARFVCANQGILTEGEGSVLLTSQ